MLAFRIRETIAIKQDSLVFDLQKNHNIIDLKAIDEIIFNDCFNIVKIKTKDSSTTINIGQFQSKKVERFFKENNLYFDEPKEI